MIILGITAFISLGKWWTASIFGKIKGLLSRRDEQ
jgi:hypothetical protein